MAVPSDFAGLQLWLDASTLSLGSLSSWPDSSGHGHTGVMQGAPNPTVIAAPGDLLGAHPVVRFNASEGHVVISSMGVTDNWTLAYVARMVGPTAGRVVGCIYPGTPTPNLLFGFWNGLEDVIYDNGFPGGVTPSSPAYSTTWKLYSGDGSMGGGSRLFKSGVLVSTVTSTPFGWGGGVVISGFDSTSSETSDCQVAEVVLYDNKLSDANRGAIETYLQEKWLEAPSAATSPFGMIDGMWG